VAKVVQYYSEFTRDMPLECKCGWSGPVSEADMDMHEQLLDYCCPVCDQMLLIVPYPTTAQTRAAAEAGNQEAIENCRVYGIKFAE
jgi:hypothetical protein